MLKNSAFFAGLLIAILINISDARQGCCSHHGGVCGCACCDGTPLSAKCAPYYDCGNNSEQNTATEIESSSDSTTRFGNSTDKSSQTVLFNTKTYKYHCPTCEWAIKCTQNCVSMSLNEAKESGGVPCKVCGGKCHK